MLDLVNIHNDISNDVSGFAHLLAKPEPRNYIRITCATIEVLNIHLTLATFSTNSRVN